LIAPDVSLSSRLLKNGCGRRVRPFAERGVLHRN
jgi:hypothetical protein